MKSLRECEPADMTTALQRLWVVMSDPDCAQQEQRQTILLETTFAVAEDRVKLRDLQLLTKIMEVIAMRAELKSKYKQYLEKILNLLKAPIKMEKSSDQLEYQCNIIEFFTTLGCMLLRTRDKAVQLQVLEIVLRCLLTKRVGDSDTVPVHPCVKALELSELSECLADFIVITEQDVYNMAILTTLQICQMSKLCCWTLLMKEVVEFLLVRLSMVYHEDEVENTCQLLWTLLRCTDRPEDWEKVPRPSRTALHSLRHVLREQALTHCHPGKDNDMLCNIASLVLKIIHLFPDADFVYSGLIEDITLSATLTESVLENHIMPFFKSKEDHLHFKKLMLACIAASPITPQSVEIYERFKLAECLVAMLRMDSNRARLSWISNSKKSSSRLSVSLPSVKSSTTLNSESVWFFINQEQSIEVFKYAIPVVFALFDCLYQKFIKVGLINSLTMFLNDFYLQDKNTIDVNFNMTIKLLFCICFSKKDPELVKHALVKTATVPVLLCSFSLLLNSENSLTIKKQSILCRILHILSALMEGQTNLQIKHSSKAFQIVQTLYERIIRPLPTDSVIDNKLVVAASHFAWVALASNEDNLQRFIDSGLLYPHLDILERSDLPAQLAYLSMLVDVVENHKSVPYLVSWRGRKGIKLLPVLCRIWREEESRLNVPRDENGCISDIERPLMGDDQFKSSKEDRSNSLSVCDVFGSCRPKIYAFVQLLQRHEDVVRLCEEHYRLGYDALPWEDQITMRLIETYFPLKLGEVWWEIFNKQEEVLSLDRYMARTLADRYLNWSLSAQKAQIVVLQQRDAVQRQQEQEYYSQVRSVRLTAALEALRQVTAIARSADRQMLLAAHQRLRENIDSSRPATDLDLHVAFPRDVRVLVVNPRAEIVVRNEPLQS